MTEMINNDRIVPRLKVNSKKQALLELAKRAALITGQSERRIFDVLLEREKLGSTGVGRGVAIPHGKLPALGQVYGLFARLERPIDFDAVDERPVDLIYVLLAPEGSGADHLKALARISRALRDEGLCNKLRGCDSVDAIHAVFSTNSAVDAA